MGIENIVEKISREAEAEGEKLKQDAASRVREIEDEYKKKITALEKAEVLAAEAEGERSAKSILTSARLELKRRVLEERQSFIEEAFQTAFERILASDADKYRSFIEKVLLETVEEGDAEIIISPKDKARLTSSFIDGVNSRLGKKGKLKLSKEVRPLEGGFVLKRGKKEINCSLPAIFGTYREELEVEIAKILFDAP